MKFEIEITALCFSRMICNENRQEKNKCIKSIQNAYGREVTLAIRKFLRKRS